jgi:hypothetical protein
MDSTAAATPSADERKTQVENALAQHSGSLERTRHWSRRIIYTPGVADMAEICKAYWLIDLIASHQIDAKVRSEEFQLWELTVDASRKAVARATDGNSNPVVSQEIDYTDFPLDTIKLYLDQGTLMLPGEY